MDLRFGFDVGRKFNEDGSVRFWPGNTMICLLDHNTEVFGRIKKIRDNFVRNKIGECITPLPDISLHMTAIEGVVDGNRSQDHWTTLLPTDALLSDVDDFFQEKWNEIPPMGKVEMVFHHIRVGTGLCVALHPKTEDDEKRIRGWREIVSEKMGLRFPSFETYEFHISLAYGYRVPNKEHMDNLENIVNEYNDEFAKDKFSFVVPEPSMTYFDNMFFFSKERIPRY